MVGSLQKSTEVMKNMQQLVKLPEIQKTMMEMSKEMMKVTYSPDIFYDCSWPKPKHVDFNLDLQIQYLYHLEMNLKKYLIES